MVNIPHCPYNKKLECWSYNQNICHAVTQDIYFGNTVHETCDKFNEAEKARRMPKSKTIIDRALDESSDESVAYLLGNPLTPSEKEAVRASRMSELVSEVMENI